ncbi:MAG: EAL domain-containing protein [Oceanospirillaceae bacterium]|nr:EAL domain-containing protein [Oceanospirillaceae bacterium]
MISLKKQAMFNKAHYVVFCVVFLCGLATSLAMYLDERSHIGEQQKALGDKFANKLSGVLQQYTSELNSVAALIESNTGDVSPRHFVGFVKSLVSNQDIQFFFAQYVPAKMKSTFESKLRARLGDTSFSIYPQGDRQEYMPLSLIYPNEIPYGFDILSTQYQDLVSVQQVRNSLMWTASKPLATPFLQTTQNAPANTIILSAPIYLPLESRSNKPTDNIVFYGVVGAYFNIENLLKQVTSSLKENVVFRIADVSADNPVWFADSAKKTLWDKGYDTHYLSLANRKWRVDSRFDSSLWTQVHLFPALSVLFSFFLLACFLTFYTNKLLLRYRSALDAASKYIEVDELTGLLSRYYVQHKLSELLVYCQEENKKLATFVLDLDHFKTINEAFGHELGDKLIVEVSRRLSNVLPKNAVIGYLGGDAFLILIVQDDLKECEPLDCLAQSIIQKISEGYYVEGLTLNIGCSIGGAVYPEFGPDATTLIKYADMALYHAKTSGRSTYRFYDVEMGGRFERNVRIERRLRKALQTTGLALHFQPKVDLISERCVGMEALLRWEDEELGVVSPAEFIPIAEQTGVILPLGDWVFEQAFRHLVEWQEQGITVPPVAINCSAAQLKRADFFPNLLSLLDKYKVDPCLLEIEVTESILIEDAESCAELLRQISRLGVKLAIDDFGTGYSSLSYLKDLPFHYVKIDQVFIRDITEDKKHAALTHAIISLGHNLNLKVIAEGISNVDQLIMLQEFGCDIGQGYLFSKALGASSMGSDPMIVALNEKEGFD